MKDYEFKVGDEIITVNGTRGCIVDICDCADCRSRGFLEPIWEDEYGEEDYITIYDAENGFKDYYRIGKYRFNEFDRDYILKTINKHQRTIANLEVRLKLMDEIEKEDKQ